MADTVIARPISQKIAAPANGWDVVMLCGQSNMSSATGYTTIDLALDTVDARIGQWGSNSPFLGEASLALDPLRHLSSGGVGPGMAFARAWLSKLGTGRKLLLVPCAQGTTRLVNSPAVWAAGNPGGSLYENAIARTNAAIASVPGSAVIGCLWSQGESDSGAGLPAYQAALEAVVDGFRARVTGAANMPFIIGGMVPEWIAESTVARPAIRDAQIAVASSRARVAYFAGPTGAHEPGDTLHYTPAGNRTRGASFASALATILGV